MDPSYRHTSPTRGREGRRGKEGGRNEGRKEGREGGREGEKERKKNLSALYLDRKSVV